MIVVAVVGILAALALPSFFDSIRKGRRSEAVAALAQVQQAQERWRANNASLHRLQLRDLDTRLAWASAQHEPGGLYTLSIDAADATGYTASATAVSGTSQANDTNCSTMRVRLADGNIQYGGCAGCAVPDGAIDRPEPLLEPLMPAVRRPHSTRPDRDRADGRDRAGRRVARAGGAVDARPDLGAARARHQCRTRHRPAIRAQRGGTPQPRCARRLSGLGHLVLLCAVRRTRSRRRAYRSGVNGGAGSCDCSRTPGTERVHAEGREEIKTVQVPRSTGVALQRQQCRRPDHQFRAEFWKTGAGQRRRRALPASVRGFGDRHRRADNCAPASIAAGRPSVCSPDGSISGVPPC